MLTRIRPLVLIDLVRLRNRMLFSRSTAPGVVLIAQEREGQPGRETFSYALTRGDREFTKHGVIEFERVMGLPVAPLGTEFSILKVASWGGPRDLGLTDQLERFPRLADVAEREHWRSGQGYKVGNEQKDATSLIGWPVVTSASVGRYALNEANLRRMEYGRLERPRKETIYRAPLVVVAQGIGTEPFHVALSLHDVVYSMSLYGIAVHEQWQGQYLNAILNSQVARYYLFLTSSRWAVERDEVLVHEIESLPVPWPPPKGDLLQELLSLEQALREALGEPAPGMQGRLDDAVDELYGLSRADRCLVRDMVRLHADPFPRTKIAERNPSREDLHQYGHGLLGVLASLLDPHGDLALWAEVSFGERAWRQAVTIRVVDRARDDPLTEVREGPSTIEDVQARAAAALSRAGAQLAQPPRVLIVHARETVYIIKPAQAQYWTCSAALADADRILQDQFRALSADAVTR